MKISVPSVIDIYDRDVIYDLSFYDRRPRNSDRLNLIAAGEAAIDAVSDRWRENDSRDSSKRSLARQNAIKV